MTVLGDIERREKKEVMGKLHEMENELKVRVRLQTRPYFALNRLNIPRLAATVLVMITPAVLLAKLQNNSQLRLHF